MGYEIKKICTVVPNSYHESTDSNYVYFSLYITSRLQFDGTLREYYEIVNWPDYESVFNYASVVDPKTGQIRLVEADDYYVKEIEKVANIDISTYRKKLWQKFFKPDVPVIAWPIYIAPETKSMVVDEEETIESASDKLATPAIKEMIAASKEMSSDKKVLEPSGTGGTKTEPKKTKKEAYYEREKYNQEFHQKITGIAKYPHLMRLLGLIRDFKVRREDIKDWKSIRFSLNTREWIRQAFTDDNDANAIMDARVEFSRSVQFIFPSTKVLIDDAVIRTDTNDQVYKKMVQNGYLIPTAPGVSFLMDQDYGENQPINSNQPTDPKTGDVVNSLSSKTFSPDELNILQAKNTDNQTSKGFSFKLSITISNDLLTNIDAALNNLTDDNVHSFEFEAHHLDCGYRPDVWHISSKKWYSLNKRKANYYVDESILPKEADNWIDKFWPDKPILNDFEDEGWIEEIRQVSDNGDLFRYNEIARWNNWSLSCPLFNAVQKQNDEYGDVEVRNMRPIKLPKLRFGEKYFPRLRIVDICGNGPRLMPKEEGPTKTNDKEGIYFRIEPLAAPLLFPPESLYKEEDGIRELKPDHYAEDNDTFVLRSKVGTDGNLQLIVPTCIRYVTPAHITQHLAELSGVFESFQDGNSINFKDLYKYLNTIPQESYNEEIISEEIPFLHDAAANKLKLNGELIPFETGTYNRKKAIKITAYGPISPDGFFEYPKEHTIQIDKDNRVALLPGHEYRLEVQLDFDKSHFKSGEAEKKEICFIHAVQRPVLLRMFLDQAQKADGNINVTAEIRKRRAQNNGFDLSLVVEIDDDRKGYKLKANNQNNFLFPTATVSEYILIASYQDYTLDSLAENGYTLNKNLVVFQQTFVNSSSIYEDQSVNDFLTSNKAFSHRFPDTKFHKATYRLEALSRFAHYFSEHQIGSDSSPFSIFGNLDEQTIYNTVRPSKPTITTIIPLLTNIKETNSYSLKHNAFRIYLGSTWYETGLGEQIAVIYNPTLKQTIDDITALAESQSRQLQERITIIADDPIDSLLSAQTNTKPIFRKNDPSETLDVGKVPPVLDIDPGIALQHFMPLEVKWDMEEHEFYCDIPINTELKQSYTYLAQFAICRYQPNSLTKPDDIRFSEIVKTQLVPILSDKQLKWTVENDAYSLSFQAGNNPAKVGAIYNGTVFTPNEIWLQFEKKSIAEHIFQVKSDKTFQVIKPKKFDFDTLSASYSCDWQNTKDIDTVFIEEYQVFNLDEQTRASNKSTENPRNDPQKRLVFFYQLTL